MIISDLDNMEAAATAYVLLGLIVPKLMGGQKNNMPAVLQKVGGGLCFRIASGPQRAGERGVRFGDLQRWMLPVLRVWSALA